VSHPSAPQRPIAPQGTSPSTVQIWLIVGLFAVQLVATFVHLASIDFSGYFQLVMDASTPGSNAASDPDAILALYGQIFTATYVVLLALSFLAYAGTVVLAYFDHRALLARGVSSPFAWALAFIPSYGSMVYLIGRSIVVRRRTGAGLAPLWVYVGLFVAGLIGSLVWSFWLIADLVSEFSRFS